jgi:hypothetical protein
MVQVGNGMVEYMTLPLFERLSVDAELGRLVEKFANSFLKSTMQLVVCNSQHSLQARCARWIFGVYDRVQRARFELAQPLLVNALGAASSAVRDVMAGLVEKRILAYDGSSVTVLDTIGLRRAACPCYAVLKRILIESRWIEPSPCSEPVSLRPNVFPMRPANVCTLCGLGAVSPHLSHSECLRALDNELHSLRARARQLTNQRSLIASELLKKYEQFRRKKSV